MHKVATVLSFRMHDYDLARTEQVKECRSDGIPPEDFRDAINKTFPVFRDRKLIFLKVETPEPLFSKAPDPMFSDWTLAHLLRQVSFAGPSYGYSAFS